MPSQKVFSLQPYLFNGVLIRRIRCKWQTRHFPVLFFQPLIDLIQISLNLFAAMIARSIPKDEQLFIWMKHLQIFQKGHGVFPIASLAGNDHERLVSQVHDAIIGLALFGVYQGHFRICANLSGVSHMLLIPKA